MAIIALAVWMLWRTRRDQREAHHADDGHDHGHQHGAEMRRIDTGHGVVTLEIFEEGVPPRWHLRTERGPVWSPQAVIVETERPDGQRQSFAFAGRDGYLESLQEIPEPHEFAARLHLSHGDHACEYEVAFSEHDHGHEVERARGLDVPSDGYQDAHERAHAHDIQRSFADRKVTTWQIVLFGLTDGLIPCPAAIMILLLCLQLKEIALGAVLVLCFSIGLAITLVTVGVVAALGMRHASKRWSGFDTFMRRAPYASGILIICVGSTSASMP